MANRERPMERGRAPQTAPGVISADALYRADELKARMGWRNAAFHAACRRGLRTHRVGKRVFITGSDVLTFVQRKGGDK
jgi:hypothetical protein